MTASAAPGQKYGAPVSTRQRSDLTPHTVLVTGPRGLCPLLVKASSRGIATENHRSAGVGCRVSVRVRSPSTDLIPKIKAGGGGGSRTRVRSSVPRDLYERVRDIDLALGLLPTGSLPASLGEISGPGAEAPPSPTAGCFTPLRDPPALPEATPGIEVPGTRLTAYAARASWLCLLAVVSFAL